MPATIRSAVPDDLTAILAIEKYAASAAHWTREQYERRMADGIVLVAEDGSISGFVCARGVAGEWEIENIAVMESARRRGLADELIKELVRRTSSQGATAVWLEVRESNHPARSLYEKNGFQVAGRRRVYYQNPEEDALVFKLSWQPGRSRYADDYKHE